MKLRYDSEADALYITLKKATVTKTQEIDRNTLLDFDEKGELVGVELLFVNDRNPDVLKTLRIENLIS